SSELEKRAAILGRDHKRRVAFRQRPQLECKLGYDCQRATAADIQLVHIIAGHVFDHAPARLALSPVSVSKLEADYVISRLAESQSWGGGGVARRDRAKCR